MVVLASNAAFYKSQGATIEEPTKDEILKAFPEEKLCLDLKEEAEKKQLEINSEIESLSAELEALKKEKSELSDKLKKAEKEKKFLFAELEALKNEITKQQN